MGLTVDMSSILMINKRGLDVEVDIENHIKKLHNTQTLEKLTILKCLIIDEAGMLTHDLHFLGLGLGLVISCDFVSFLSPPFFFILIFQEGILLTRLGLGLGLGLVGDLDVMSFVSPHIFLDYSV